MSGSNGEGRSIIASLDSTQPEIILLCLRWYLTYPLSYRQVAEMVNELGMEANYTTIFR